MPLSSRQTPGVPATWENMYIQVQRRVPLLFARRLTFTGLRDESDPVVSASWTAYCAFRCAICARREQYASNGSERKHTVRFCLQPNLPTDSSDIDDGVSSSSDEAEERDTPVNRMALDFEEDDDGERRREDFVLLLQQTQATQREILKLSTELKAHRRRNKVSSPLYGCLKISLVTVLGVLFFWWATDQLEWME